MNKKATDIVGYIGIVGWLIAFFGGTKEESKFHLNQGLVITIIETGAAILSPILRRLPMIGWTLAAAMSAVVTACGVFAIIGIVFAAKGIEKELPIVSKIQILK